MLNRLVIWACAAAGVAGAQPVINDVVNAASRTPSGFSSYGIAQGALFAVTGKKLGPDQLQQASFPLPTTDGLGGVTVQVTVGGATVNAIMVYVSAAEVGAILPSSTPIGTGTVTLNNNGATVSAPTKVVASAFGMFSLDYYSGVQYAAAFNVEDDGSTALNWQGPPFEVAHPGQNIILNGTGLGAIPSDETQCCATDTPAAQIKIWVGSLPATLVSAGRGPWIGLPDGLPPFPVPQGLAAWDVVQFTIPDGVLGCHVPVTVQTGNIVSNSLWISVAPAGSPCLDVNAADYGDTVTFTDTARVGYVNMLRTLQRDTLNGTTVEIGTETGTSGFTQFDVPSPATVRVSDYTFANLANNVNPGTCLVQTFRYVQPDPSAPTDPAPAPTGPAPKPPTVLDAGATINLLGPGGAKYQLKKDKNGSYGGGLGSSFAIPGIPAADSLFLKPGIFTVDNGAGGADVPGFRGTVELPKPLVSFDNLDQLGASVDRTKGVTIKWSGGDPNSFVVIAGTSLNQVGNVTLSGNFSCAERVSAGQFTVPPFVTIAMPVTVGKPPSPPIGTIALWTYAVNRIDAPTLDLAVLSIVLDIQKGILFQ